MQEIKIVLRDKEYSGTVVDDDAIFFASMYYNDAEKQLAEEGKEQEAFIHLADRLSEYLAKSENQEKADQEFTGNIALKIRRETSTNFETRKMVCWRLLECFPDMDQSLIFWHNENKFGIRLSMEELITVFIQIIAVAFKATNPLVSSTITVDQVDNENRRTRKRTSSLT